MSSINKFRNIYVAYFVGVLHTDGSIFKYYNKSKKRNVFRLEVKVGEKSLPMVQKTCDILNKEFHLQLNVRYEGRNKYGTKMFAIKTEINRLILLFNDLEINKNKFPLWIENNKKFFYSYLAGVIDGDGTIDINSKTSQCRIRITSGEKQIWLINLIDNYLNCKSWIEKTIRINEIGINHSISKIYRHCFYISSKNILIFKKYVYPFICIEHKKKRFDEFLEMENFSLKAPQLK